MIIPKALKLWDFLFFILLLGISFLYSYEYILFMRPCSIHQWRQCDSLSITLNYYKQGMHFFTPALNNCGATGDGVTCPTEFPLIYYTVALLWKVLGYHEYIFRLLDTIIGFAGLYALFRLTKELIQDGAWALMVSLLLFTSPIFAVYTNNFIPDTSALSIAIIAWYFFVRYYKTKRLFFFNLSVLFFLLAGLIKITALLSFVPLIIIFIWELLKKNKIPEAKIFINPVKQGVSIFLLVLIVSAWVVYSANYRNSHNAGFFLTIQHPIWEFDLHAIHDTIDKLYYVLLPQYFYKPFIFFILALFLILLINYKKMNHFYYWLILLVFAGCIFYIMLWFSNFRVHDYYLINVLIFIPTTLLSLLVFLKERYYALFNSSLLKIAFALILGWNIYYCAVQTNVRYFPKTPFIANTFILSQDEINFWNWFHENYQNRTKALETITPYLRSLGISRDDKVISIPDQSPDITLYLMDQKGFSDFGSSGGLDNSNEIKEFIHAGTKYLIISEPSMLNDDWLKPYLKNKIGSYQNVTIYNLRNLD